MVHPDAADVGKVYLPLEILQPATHGLSLPSIDTQQPARLHEEWTLSTPQTPCAQICILYLRFVTPLLGERAGANLQWKETK